MKFIVETKGFTLIETLVAINLSFIGLTFVVSFYLFVLKFTQTISEHNTNLFIYQNFFFELEKCIECSDAFRIESHPQYALLSTTNSDTLIIYKDSLILNGILKLSDIDGCIASIFNYNIDSPIQLSGNNSSYESHHFTASSKEIRSIHFQIKTTQQFFSYEIFVRAFSANRFIDLVKEE
ncbi:MAG: hypothetical protein IPM56_03150 [Ignavibacteriales bacterium]|nr:MAG: hypothetical protein IPM56_03150 [Ignavibacteriales bacterium]